MPIKPSPSPITSPSADISPLLAGLNASNLIITGENNVIFNSRRCTLINTDGVELGKSYNMHIIGSQYTIKVPSTDSSEIFTNNNFSTSIDYWQPSDPNNAYYVSGYCVLRYGASVNQVVQTNINQTYKMSITLDISFNRGVRVIISDSNDSSNIFLNEVLDPGLDDDYNFELKFSSKSRFIRVEFRNEEEEFYLSAINNVSLLAYNNGRSHSLYVFGEINAVDCDVSSVYQLSDKRLKDNIKPIENCLEKVLKLEAIEFDWNDKQQTYKGHDIGLVAQQVEAICPEIVETRRNGFKAIKYEKITALLVGAIKEQQEIIDEIERKLSIN